MSFPLLTDTFQWLAGPKSLNSSIQQRVEQVACTTRFAFKLPRPPFIPAVPTAAEEVGGASQLAMPKTYPKKLQLYGASAATGDRRLPSDNPGQKKIEEIARETNSRVGDYRLASVPQNLVPEMACARSRGVRGRHRREARPPRTVEPAPILLRKR